MSIFNECLTLLATLVTKHTITERSLEIIKDIQVEKRRKFKTPEKQHINSAILQLFKSDFFIFTSLLELPPEENVAFFL
jgi:hypothetical protein